MKKFSVYYLPTSMSVMTNIYIWAGSAAEAIEHIEKNGVGFHDGPVFAHRIVAVETECEMEGETPPRREFVLTSFSPPEPRCSSIAFARVSSHAMISADGHQD